MQYLMHIHACIYYKAGLLCFFWADGRREHETSVDSAIEVSADVEADS